MNLDERIRNWVRYFRDRTEYSRCCSIEGKLYQAPWRQWVSLQEIQVPEPIDWRDAEILERAWKVMMGKPKLLIKYYYMTGFPVNVVARKSRIKPWQIEVELARAKRVLQNILDNQGDLCQDIRKLDPPSARLTTANDRGLVRPKETEPA